MLILGILIAIAVAFAAVGAWVRRKFGGVGLTGLALVTAVGLATAVSRVEPFRWEFRDVYGLAGFAATAGTIAAALVLNWRARPSELDPDLLLDTLAGAAVFLVTAALAFLLPLMGMPRMA
jgi:hypothetical protein